MSNTNPHNNGPWYVEHNAICNRHSNACTNNPAVLIDTECGIVLKSGDKSMIQNYMHTAASEYLDKKMVSIAQTLTVINFDQYRTLNIDEICTLMNYMQNSIGPRKMNELLTMSETALKAEIKRLTQYGF